jgi:putative methionine-R-sulfoxide reductase with GAF domain
MLWKTDDQAARVFEAAFFRARAIEGDRAARMRAAADALWDALHGVGVSWIGFYEIAREGHTYGAEAGSAMVLGPHRDKPACSPIGLHGACGRAWRERRTLVVRDVASLGAGYVACDPRDRSELVIPCFDADGACWGVLDADSFEAECFDTGDAAAVHGFLVSAGLTTGEMPPVDVI